MSKQKINIGNSQKEKIVTNELIINQKVFIYKETIIPLNNISRISMAGEQSKPYQIYSFVMLLVGVLFLFIGSIIPVLFGLILLAVGAFSIYQTYKENRELGEYLIFNLNSGRDIYLYTRQHEFAIEIMDVIINCINSGEEYKINMSNCKIEMCQFGENNTVSR